jgi:transcriptional regulator with XRE-family HTH domain
MTTAIATKLADISDSLLMSQEEIGEVIGASGRTVSRWTSGEVAPQRAARQRLLEFAYVADELSKVMKPEDANLWVFAPNALLQHDSPADRIRHGDYRTVLALIEALADGIVA